MRNAKLTILGSGQSSAVATEIITPSSTSIARYSFTGAASAHAALADASDASYIFSASYTTSGSATVNSDVLWQGNFTDLTQAAGRGIASFTITGRARNSTVNGIPLNLNIGSITGITLTPSSYATGNLTGTITTYTSTTYTKSGGGNITEAQINSVTGSINIAGGGATLKNSRLYQVYITVTYA